MSEANSTVTYRDIPGHPGYRVGDDGSVWSCLVKVSRGYHKGSRTVIDPSRWRLLKPQTDKDGYFKVFLSATSPGGKGRWRLVHHLVLEAFVGPRPDGMEGCHFPDPDRTNNRPSNLRWDTRAANAADSIITGTYVHGETHGRATLTELQVRTIRAEYAAGGVTQTQLGLKHGIRQTLVSDIVTRRRWRHVA